MVMLDYAHNPLLVYTEDADGETENLGGIVEHQLYLHLNGSFGLFEWVSINVDIPIAVYQGGDSPEVGSTAFSSPDSAQFGDLRLGARVRLWGEYHDPFQIGVGGYLWFPTGPSDDGSYVGDGYFRGLPLIYAGGLWDERVAWSFSAGPEIRASHSFTGTTQGTSMYLGAAGGVLLGPERQWQVGPEINVYLTFDELARRNTNAEGMVGVKYRFLDFMEAGLAAGPGFSAGIGTPDFRGVFSLAYTPKVEQKTDRDGDGILDKVDACPDEAGEPNDDPRKHGCPPPDKDGDGILDADDACPETPGIAFAGEPDKHGCPDKDKDGIIDSKDACPDKKGVAHEDPKKHGCPPPGDRDGDGITDDLDACPDTAGVASEDPQKHGCPPDTDTDTDGDGILDPEDACPKEPKVKTDDPQTNGCPPDRDNDKILDPVDACPDEPGVQQADPKKNGCPIVKVQEKEIVILQRVEFDTAKATIKPVSDQLLDEVAKVLIKYTEIELVEVQGHTDNKGPNYINIKLSRDRAKAVMDALINRKVEAKRLTSKGFGPTVPIADNNTEEGRQKNRRVQFKILKRTKKVPVKTK